jgi:hypothetical protein
MGQGVKGQHSSWPSLPLAACELDCLVYYRARDLSDSLDLGFPPLLRAVSVGLSPVVSGYY